MIKTTTMTTMETSEEKMNKEQNRRFACMDACIQLYHAQE
jgi:hypothetical protein